MKRNLKLWGLMTLTIGWAALANSAQNDAESAGASAEGKKAKKVNAAEEESAIDSEINKPEEAFKNWRPIEGDCTVSGVVVDVEGNPLPGMRVVSARTNPNDVFSFFPETVADENGRFHATNVQAGRYKLTALPPGTIGDGGHAGILPVRLTSGQEVDSLRLVHVVDPDALITGQVTASNGNPIEGARVVAFLLMTTGTVGCQTDSDGRYTLYVIPERKFEATVSHPDYTGEMVHGVQAGSRDVDFELLGRGAIAGRVVDARTGRPITTYTVSSGKSSVSRAYSVAQPWTKEIHHEEGLFFADKVQSGEHLLTVRADGYAPLQIASVAVRPNETNDTIVARMTRGATLQGRVVSMDGKPIADARLSLTNPVSWLLLPEVESWGSHTLAQRTDSEGRFELSLLSPEFRELTVTHPDYPETTTALELTDGKVSSVEFVMTGLATVEGSVYLDGVPVPGRRVRAGLLTTVNPPDGQTDSQGYFHITDVPAGDVIVRTSIELDGKYQLVEAHVHTRQGYTSTVVLEANAGTATIAGVLTQGGVPVERLSTGISASAIDGHDYVSTIGLCDGVFRLKGLVGGTYKILAFDQGVKREILGSTVVTVEPGAEAEAILEIGAP